MPAAHIEDYGVIGDCRSAALVSRHGSIDWLCWPRFDSPSLFAALLDRDRGGRFAIAPGVPFSSTRAYAADSNVLVTTFATAGGEARLTDDMPVMSEDDKRRTLVPEHEIVRVVECVRGEVPFEVVFQPRPGYARKPVAMRATPRLGVRVQDGPRLYTLRSDRELALAADGGEARARFSVRAGERATFSLAFDHSGPAVLPPLGARCDEAIARSNAWWRGWAGSCTYAGPYRHAVVRSLLTLKLLSYAPSGAIVAAPTTSLPERIGGDLNWDYRYCWIRDAALTVRSLCDLGFDDEAGAFVSWLLHTTRLTRPALSVLYDVYGERPGRERTLDHLAGHMGSRPVRIHNAAVGQLQLDGYGELIQAVTESCRRDRLLDRETQVLLRQLGEYVCDHWREPDQGIWEPREPPRQHTYSRVMCWVALDRLLWLASAGLLRGIPRQRFERERTQIRDEVERRGFNPGLGSYTQVLDGDTVDASLLLLDRFGFVATSDARMRGTYRRIVERLGAGPGLVYRNEQSLADAEGAFAICSAWAIEHLAAGGGSLADATTAFEDFLGHANDLGLYAEEIDPASGRALGNFPQAFSHVGLISVALAIEARRARDEAPAAAQGAGE
jgi:GH15 family glucan-1,4-alpha-glucosidase